MIYRSTREDVATAEDLRTLADALEAGTIRVVRHKNLLAVLKPEQVLTLDDVREALLKGSKERKAAEKTLKRSPRR